MTEVSSIGIINEYFVDKNNDRVKGFFLDIVDSKSSLEFKVKEFDEQLKYKMG
jgi:hypothetical protein